MRTIQAFFYDPQTLKMMEITEMSPRTLRAVRYFVNNNRAYACRVGYFVGFAHTVPQIIELERKPYEGSLRVGATS